MCTVTSKFLVRHHSLLRDSKALFLVTLVNFAVIFTVKQLLTKKD